MNFLSAVFMIFLAVVYALWRIVPKKYAKVLLCISSFVFYSYWFPPYILLLLTSGFIDFTCSKRIHSSANWKKGWLIISILSNLSILFLFKYANFFFDLFYSVRSEFGGNVNTTHLNLILPIGISFYTFQSMSYTIDVYNKKLKPCENAIDFFMYLSFFPQLVAGPIVRAVDFLPQLGGRARLDEEGWYFFIYRMARGFFLKIVVADNIALVVDKIFANSPGDIFLLDAWFGAMLFAIQIFCDFAGYSDIAIGVGRLFGFRIRENFINPFIASSFKNFWERWHISLSTWFKDYVYIPLGGNRKSERRTNINLVTVFLVSGLWHGANLTFLFWGLVHGIAYLVERAARRLNVFQVINSKLYLNILYGILVQVIVVIAWVPFRAESIGFAIKYWKNMFFAPLGQFPHEYGYTVMLSLLLFAGYFIWSAYKDKNAVIVTRRNMSVEIIIYFAAIMAMPGSGSDFIYFQF